MSCGSNNYFVGNGEVLVRKRADDCGNPSSGWRKLGDASELMISVSQDFGNHYESTTGNRTRSARWLNQTEVNFTLSVSNFTSENLADLLLGTSEGAITAATVSNEAITNCYEGAWVFAANPGWVAGTYTVYENTGSPGTLLTEGTDYTVDTRNGGIYIITGGPNLTDVATNGLTVDYDHVGASAVIEALTVNSQDYQVRFNGINLNATNTPVIVTLKRAQFNATEELSLIGQDITSLSFTGALLPDENTEFFDIKMVNAVA